MDVSWNGPDPEHTTLCPYRVNFYCRPAPAESLNSLESGRLLLQLDLAAGVRSVAGRLINNAKRENLGKLQAASRIKRQTSISTTFVQDDTQQHDKWVGELSIPAGWVEGRTRTYERTGRPAPRAAAAAPLTFIPFEITYTLDNGNTCTARFSSEDAFYWQTRPKAAK